MTYYGDEAFPALSDEQWARKPQCRPMTSRPRNRHSRTRRNAVRPGRGASVPAATQRGT